MKTKYHTGTSGYVDWSVSKNLWKTLKMFLKIVSFMKINIAILTMKVTAYLDSKLRSVRNMFIILVIFQNCSKESPVVSCTGCGGTSPYSTPNSSACYATLSACQAALGSACRLCN